MFIVTNSDIMGKNIAYLRRQHGLSREKLGQMVDIEELELRDIENGDIYEIDSVSLSMLCEIFDLDMDAFLKTPLWNKE